MKVSVVVPATRPSVADLEASLRLGSRVPDEIIVVSNEVAGGDVTVRFDSDDHPIGWGDAGLRRDIGADLATGDIIVFLDDDQIAPRNLIEAAAEIAERDGFCWGHHRFIDFDTHPLDTLLDLDPEEGRPREVFANGWHGWQSSYAGNLAIRREMFWDVGGFDLAYLGHHGSEDQQLGFRLGEPNGHRTFVHEPPFAWHPETLRYQVRPHTNVEAMHTLERTEINGHPFVACTTCCYRQPLEIMALTTSNRVVIPYSREQFTLAKERI